MFSVWGCTMAHFHSGLTTAWRHKKNKIVFSTLRLCQVFSSFCHRSPAASLGDSQTTHQMIDLPCDWQRMTNYPTNGLLDCWELTRLAGSLAVIFLFFFISLQCGGLNSLNRGWHVSRTGSTFFFSLLHLHWTPAWNLSCQPVYTGRPVSSPPFSLPPFLCFLSALSISLCRGDVDLLTRHLTFFQVHVPLLALSANLIDFGGNIIGGNGMAPTFTALSSLARQKTLQLRIFQKITWIKSTYLNHFGEIGADASVSFFLSSLPFWPGSSAAFFT